MTDMIEIVCPGCKNIYTMPEDEIKFLIKPILVCKNCGTTANIKRGGMAS